MSPVEGHSSAGPLTAIDQYQSYGNRSRMSPPYDYNPSFKPAKGILKQRSRILQREQQASASWISTLNSKLSGNQNANGNLNQNADSQRRNGTDPQQDGKNTTSESRSPTGLASGLSNFRKLISNATGSRIANANGQSPLMSLENSSVTSLSSLTSDTFEDSNFELDPEDLKRVRFSIQQLTTEYHPYDNPQYVDDIPQPEETKELKVGSAEVNPATLDVITDEDTKFNDKLDSGTNAVTCEETSFEEVTPVEKEEGESTQVQIIAQSPSGPCSPSDLLIFYETACRNKDEHMFQPLVRQLQEHVHLSHLSSIDLSNFLVDREVAEPISDILTLDHNIQKLIIQNCGLEDETIRLILNGLLTSDSVKYLNIANNKKIKSNGFKYIAIYMRESTSLQVLNLSLNNFDKKSIQMISQGLISKKASRSALETLILDACLFRPSLLEALAVGVKNTASLKTLSLRNNRINQQGASWIGVMLRDYVGLGFYASSTDSISSTTSIQHGLERLALDGNDLRQGIQFVAQALKRNQSLKELGLSGCKIDARSFVYLGDALKYNQALEKLNVSNNDLSVPVRDGFHALAVGLQHHPALRDLDLKGTSMKTDDVIVISKSLPFCKSLMRLDIRNNPWIAKEGYSCLADEMKRNHTLAFLEIDVSQANPELTQLLSEILTHCSRNTRRNFTQTDNGENNSASADIKDAPNGAIEGIVSKTKAQVTARMTLQERLAAVTRGASSKGIAKPSSTAAKPAPSAEDELREKLELKRKEEESIMKEIEIASEHHVLLEDMLAASANDPTEANSDVKETLERLHLQCETSQRLIMSFVPRITDETLLDKLLTVNDKLTTVISQFEKKYLQTSETDQELKEDAEPAAVAPQVAEEPSFAIGDDDDDDDIPSRPNTSVIDTTSFPKDDKKIKLEEKRRETEKEEGEALKMAKQLIDSELQDMHDDN